MAATGGGEVFGALADGTRLRVLERLGAGPASATTLAAGLQVTRQAVDKHLAVLTASGLVDSERVGREVRHRVRPDGFDRMRAELERLRSLSVSAPAAAGPAPVSPASARTRPEDRRDRSPDAPARGGATAGRRPGPHLEPTAALEDEVAAWAALGLDELWRPDAATVVLGAGGRACVMCVDHALERALGPGPVILVDSLAADRPVGVSWKIAPCRVAAGRYAAFGTASGRIVRLLELSPGAPDVFGPLPSAPAGAAG